MRATGGATSARMSPLGGGSAAARAYVRRAFGRGPRQDHCGESPDGLAQLVGGVRGVPGHQAGRPDAAPPQRRQRVDGRRGAVVLATCRRDLPTRPRLRRRRGAAARAGRAGGRLLRRLSDARAAGPVVRVVGGSAHAAGAEAVRQRQGVRMDVHTSHRLGREDPVARAGLPLDRPLREAGDEPVEEQVEHQRDGQRDEHGGGLQGLPEEHVAADELGRHPGGDHLLRGG